MSLLDLWAFSQAYRMRTCEVSRWNALEALAKENTILEVQDSSHLVASRCIM